MTLKHYPVRFECDSCDVVVKGRRGWLFYDVLAKVAADGWRRGEKNPSLHFCAKCVAYAHANASLKRARFTKPKAMAHDDQQ